MSYNAWSVVFREQPSTTKWNLLGSNDAYFDTALKDGWNEAGETWTYNSADDPTYSFLVSGDKTTKYYPGMRIKLTNGGTVKYFIVTLVQYSAPNTVVTIYGGTDYDLANSAITLPYFSTAKAPAGFPLDPLKWTQTTVDTGTRSQASPSASTWYNVGSLSLVVPIGSWRLSYSAYSFLGKAGAAVNLGTTLSTTTNSDTDSHFKVWSVGNGNASIGGQVAATHGRDKNVILTSKTTYYLLAETTVSSADTIYFDGAITPTIIKAVCAYL